MKKRVSKPTNSLRSSLAQREGVTHRAAVHSSAIHVRLVNPRQSIFPGTLFSLLARSIDAESSQDASIVANQRERNYHRNRSPCRARREISRSLSATQPTRSRLAGGCWDAVSSFVSSRVTRLRFGTRRLIYALERDSSGRRINYRAHSVVNLGLVVNPTLRAAACESEGKRAERVSEPDYAEKERIYL